MGRLTLRTLALVLTLATAVSVLPIHAVWATTALPIEIVIVGDVGPTGFVLTYDPLTGGPIYRPGSGVTSGQGTEVDPFVIDEPRVSRIHLLQTTAHVLIRDGVVQRANAWPADEAAIRIEDAANVRIEGTLAEGIPSIVIERSARIGIESSALRAADEYVPAVLAVDSVAIAVRNSSLSAQRDRGFSGSGLTSVDLSNNTFGDANTLSYFVERSEGVTIRDHGSASALGPVSLSDNAQTSYTRNHATTTGGYDAINAVRESDLSIDNASISSLGDGITLWQSDHVVIRDSSVSAAGHGAGIMCSETADLDVINVESSTQWGAGLDATSCPRSRITSSTFHGVNVEQADAFSLVDSTIEGSVIVVANNATIRRTSMHGGYETSFVGDGLTLVGNEFAAVYAGTYVTAGPGSNVEGNTFRDTRKAALRLIDSHGARVDGNRFENVTTELLLDGSTDLTIDNHTLRRGMAINAYQRGDLRHTLGSNNLVQGRPIILLHNVSNTIVTPGYSQLFLSESTNVTILEPNLDNVSRGITVAFTSNVSVIGGSIADTGIGIDSFYDAGMTLQGVSLARNSLGAYAWASDDLTIAHSDLVDNGYAAMIDLGPSDSVLTMTDVVVAGSHGFGVWAQDGRLDVGRSSFTGNGHDPAYSFRDFGFPGDPGILTSSRNASLTASRFVGNDLGIWTMKGGDATRNYWGCPEGPGAPGCDDAVATNAPTPRAPWCENDVYAEGTCAERASAARVILDGDAAQSAPLRFAREDVIADEPDAILRAGAILRVPRVDAGA